MRVAEQPQRVRRFRLESRSGLQRVNCQLRTTGMKKNAAGIEEVEPLLKTKVDCQTGRGRRPPKIALICQGRGKAGMDARLARRYRKRGSKRPQSPIDRAVPTQIHRKLKHSIGLARQFGSQAAGDVLSLDVAAGGDSTPNCAVVSFDWTHVMFGIRSCTISCNRSSRIELNLDHKR